MSSRTARLRRLCRSRSLVLYLEADGDNIRYLTGFTGHDALVLAGRKDLRLLVDPRYTLQAAAECRCPVTTVRDGVWRYAARRAARTGQTGRGASRLAVNARGLSLARYRTLCRESAVRWSGQDDLVAMLRLAVPVVAAYGGWRAWKWWEKERRSR